MIDLHFHSTCSDGQKSNREIIKEAKEKWLKLAVCTDHDYVNDDFTRLALNSWISSVEGVEISWVDDMLNKHLHLTSYSRSFQWRIIEILDWSRKIKQEKVKLQIELLASNWFLANWEEFNSFTRNNWAIWDFNSWHIATYILNSQENLVLVKKITWEEITTWAFIRRFLKREWDFWHIGSVTIPEYEPNIPLLWELARENEAILSISHPNFKLTVNQFRARIESYLNAWVNAIEINTKASPEWVKLILEYKQKYHFMLTFWSDSHFKDFKDSKHWELWELNPFVSKRLIKQSMKDFEDFLLI